MKVGQIFRNQFSYVKYCLCFYKLNDNLFVFHFYSSNGKLVGINVLDEKSLLKYYNKTNLVLKKIK